MNVVESDMKLHVIAGNTTGVIEKNIINADMGLLQIFPNLEYCGNGDKENKLPHIKFKTGSAKIIYVLGYDNVSKWKNALGSQFGCVWVDECNTANIDFIREIFGRSEYFVGTLNPDTPTLPIYSEYINHARPIDKYKADVPEEIWKDLNECKPIKNWVYWFFKMTDNISMTPEKIEQKELSYPPGTKIYKNKILGLRGKATGLVFSNFCNRHILTKEQAKEYIRCEVDVTQDEYFIIFTSGLDTAYSTKSPDTIAMSFMGITNKECPLDTVPELAGLSDVVWNDNFIMAVPMMFYKSARYKGRGKSIFDAKIDNFDALDEAWSQWMDALRKNRTKEYIPENMLPRNPYTGKVLKPNAFDNAYISTEASMKEGQTNKIDLVQGNIPHESYLATYITALDLCLQGIMSPSTLGIDVKKLDNAEAQREKEKATLYSRNNIVGQLQKVLPKLVDIVFKAMDTFHKTPIKDTDIDVTFGEYANPSFESQVETVSKAKQGGIMSIEASVDELYGDTKDDEWKQEEIARLKAEQGISDMEEPALNMQADGFTVDGADNSFTGFDNK